MHIIVKICCTLVCIGFLIYLLIHFIINIILIYSSLGRVQEVSLREIREGEQRRLAVASFCAVVHLIQQWHRPLKIILECIFPQSFPESYCHNSFLFLTVGPSPKLTRTSNYLPGVLFVSDICPPKFLKIKAKLRGGNL